MKHLTIYSILLFILLCKSDKVIISGLSTSYMYNQSIVFDITNESNEKLYYYVGIECFQNNKWRELINDVNNPKSNSSIILTLSPNKKKKEIIVIKNILYAENFLNFEKYRIKVTYGNSLNIDKLYFSSSFKIVKKSKFQESSGNVLNREWQDRNLQAALLVR